MAARQNSSLLPPPSGTWPQLQHGNGGTIPGARLLITSCIVLAVYNIIGRFAANPWCKRDTVWLSFAILLANRVTVYEAVCASQPPSAYLYLVGVLCLQLATAALLRSSRQENSRVTNQAESPFLVPTLFPCRTTHARLLPTKHSFSYSYLLVGVPVAWKSRTNSLLSVDGDAGNRTWFSVNANDYLARGEHKDGLEGKLKEYLSLQGVPTHRFPYAYLITAPRFLGFSFNPVSFWYLYDDSKTLAAMILEVNNTFDERRMYYMESVVPESGTSRQNFSASWMKDFHVSPFNDRQGSYSLTAKHLTSNSQEQTLDNNIVLKDSDGHAKIVARVFSTAPGVDPATLSKVATLKLLARWWWVGFMTNPRILREARKLWVKKLQVYYRPEVFKTSIGRSDTMEEISIEPFFQAFLTELAIAQDHPTIIQYKAAAGVTRGSSIRLPTTKDTHQTQNCQLLDIHVLTPAFYSELVRGNSIMETFTRFCFSPDNNQAMLSVSNPKELQAILESYTLRLSNTPLALQIPLRQRAVSCLRMKSVQRVLEATSAWCTYRNRKPPSPSEFDTFVGQSQPVAAYKAYLRSVSNVLLADCIAFGFGGLLSLYRIAIRWACLAQIGQKTALLAAFCGSNKDLAILLSLVAWILVAHTSRL